MLPYVEDYVGLLMHRDPARCTVNGQGDLASYMAVTAACGTSPLRYRAVSANIVHINRVRQIKLLF